MYLIQITPQTYPDLVFIFIWYLALAFVYFGIWAHFLSLIATRINKVGLCHWYYLHESLLFMLYCLFLLFQYFIPQCISISKPSLYPCVWLPATSITCIIVIYLLWARGNLFSLSCVSQASIGMSHLLVIPPGCEYKLSSVSHTVRTYLKCKFYWWNDKATLFSLHSSSFLDCGRLLDDLNHQMTEVTKLRRMLDDINTQPMETRSAP